MADARLEAAHAAAAIGEKRAGTAWSVAAVARQEPLAVAITDLNAGRAAVARALALLAGHAHEARAPIVEGKRHVVFGGAGEHAWQEPYPEE